MDNPNYPSPVQAGQWVQVSRWELLTNLLIMSVFFKTSDELMKELAHQQLEEYVKDLKKGLPIPIEKE